MTNIHMINELNNNTIFAGNAKKKIQLSDAIVDTRNDTGSIPGLYKIDDGYRPYTIYGNAGEFPQILLFSLLSSLSFSLACYKSNKKTQNLNVLACGGRRKTHIFFSYFLSLFSYTIINIIYLCKLVI